MKWPWREKIAGIESVRMKSNVVEIGAPQNASREDFIDLFLHYTEGDISPEMFRLWSAISLVAGALERRVWIKNGSRFAYPNLYTLLVAPPGVGKGIIENVRDLWTETCQPGTKTPAFHVAPDSMTKASLIDTLEEASTSFLGTGGAPFRYNSLLVAAEEFSVLLPAYDMEYIGVLNSIWQNKARHEERRRHGRKQQTMIENPTLNLLGGAQPAWLAALFPEEAWNTGLARRLVMIYATDTPHRSLFYDPEVDESIRALVLKRLGDMSGLYGQMQWEGEAIQSLDGWYMRGDPLMGGPPVPEHSKLQHYNRSRGLLALKLCIIASIARSLEKVIRLIDVERALGWLIEAERRMPDIFRAMVGRSDRDVIDELHMYLMALFQRDKKKVPGEALRRFLLERVPHEKVETIIAAAERANIIARVASASAADSDNWIPRPRYNNSPE